MNGEKIECPFCGEKTVLVTVLTKLCFKAEHTMYTNGADMNGDTNGNMFGEMACEPMIHYSSYRCTSCGRRWFPFEYELIIEDGRGMFKEIKGKGKKVND